MPLVKRAVEPVFVCRAALNQKIKNELDGVVVNSLSGLIKQLSSVSKHAENLFGDLVNEANGIYLRTVALNGRVRGLQDKVAQLDTGGKEDGECWGSIRKNDSLRRADRSPSLRPSMDSPQNTLDPVFDQVVNINGHINSIIRNGHD